MKEHRVEYECLECGFLTLDLKDFEGVVGGREGLGRKIFCCPNCGADGEEIRSYRRKGCDVYTE